MKTEMEEGREQPKESVIPEQEKPSEAPNSEEIDTEALRELTKLYREGRINDLLEWYEANRELPMRTKTDRRPLFKLPPNEKPTNTGIQVNPEILRRAKEKMNSDRARVGKSLSQLIEFLLWAYVGCPDDLVE
jgi:hypothetical protein